MMGARAALALTLLVLTGTATSAMAGTFVPPEGCTGFVTVQARSCKVSNHYRCAQDAPGDQWRVDFGEYGPYFASRIDHEAQWVQSIDLGPGREQWLMPDPADPASFSELLERGVDTFDFRLAGSDGTGSRVTGFDRLTGETVVIDGVALKRTAFEFRETTLAGTLLRQARGHEYIHPEWRLFLSGPSEWDGGEGFVPMDYSPVEFIFPGEPGFFATRPKHDCEVTMSSAQPAQKETTHDPL